MAQSRKKRELYGIKWADDWEDLAIELEMIRRGGKADVMFEHFMRARQLAWPSRYRHRWTDQIYHEICNNIVTILMGAGSTQKTSHGAEYCLLDYWASPENTIVIMSTTTVDKLDLAVFGEVKMLFNSARALHPWLPGHPLESKRAITTDSLEENDTRDIRKGIIGRPCFVGKQYVGLGTYAGVKQGRIRFLADELQFMAPTFLDCLPNMFQSCDMDANGEPDIKVIGSGNPKHDPADQLSVAAEPVDGWKSVEGIRSGKIELEKKEDTRERMGKSPDAADAFSFGVFGAIDRGFKLGRIGYDVIEKEGDQDFFDTEAKQYQDAVQAGLLKHDL